MLIWSNRDIRLTTGLGEAALGNVSKVTYTTMQPADDPAMVRLVAGVPRYRRLARDPMYGSGWKLGH